MSHPLATDEVAGSQERSPIYTETAPLIWLDLSVPGRWITELQRAPSAYEPVPITVELYASLHKVSGLVASRIAEPDGLRQLSQSPSHWDGLSGLLLYVILLISRIHHGIVPAMLS